MRGLILSAGLGERLRPITSKRAKPAVEFLNIPMLGFPYYWMNTLGLHEITFNTHYLPDSIRHAAMHVVSPQMPMHFTHETAILGSGGGIWNARFHLQGDENFVVANGDGVILCEDHDVLERMVDFHIEKKALATLLVCPLEGVGTRIPGVWMNSYGEVCNFGKAPKQSHAECFHYASYMILNKRIWDYLPEGSSNILYDVLEPRIVQGEHTYGFRVDNMRWYETGNAQEYLQATQDCLEQVRLGTRLGRCVENILEAHAPPFSLHSDFGQRRLVADVANVASSASLKGFQVLGECEVGPYAILEDCVVLPQTKIESSASHRFEIVI
ncbi:MAG: NDP-sugar synthase [Bdellovibrionales bacterium]|nr:NDP-sugar synthase [Bdellovibrionales bacterium]